MVGKHQYPGAELHFSGVGRYPREGLDWIEDGLICFRQVSVGRRGVRLLRGERPQQALEDPYRVVTQFFGAARDFDQALRRSGWAQLRKRYPDSHISVQLLIQD